MRLPIAVLTGFSLVALAANASALARLAGGEMTLTSSVTVGYDSNINANANGEDDFFGTARADVNWRRQDRYLAWGAGFGVWGTAFLDAEGEDRVNWTVNVFLNPTDEIGGRRFRFDAGVNISRRTEADADLGARTTSTDYSGRVGVTYLPHRKYFLGAGVFASYSDPEESQYIEEFRYGADARVGWHYSEKLDFSLNARYSKTDSDDPNEIASTIYGIGGGVTGQFTPKLTGSAYFGWQFREVDSRDTTEDSPYANVSLSWAINDLSSATLALSRDFGTVSSDFNTESTSVSLTYQRTLNRRLSGSAGLSYRTTDYSNDTEQRTNDYWDASVGLGYDINRWLDASVSCHYSDQESTNDFLTFDRTRVEFTLTGRW